MPTKGPDPLNVAELKHLPPNAYSSLLKKAVEYDEDDWLHAGKFERHAISAVLDIQMLTAELQRVTARCERLEAALRDAIGAAERIIGLAETYSSQGQRWGRVYANGIFAEMYATTCFVNKARDALALSAGQTDTIKEQKAGGG